MSEEYKVVISETFKEKKRVFSPLKKEHNKFDKKQKLKWYNLLLKIRKLK